MANETMTKPDAPPAPETRTATGELYAYQEYPKMLYKPAPTPDEKKEKEKEELPPLTLVVASKDEEDKAAKDGWSEDIPGVKKPEKPAAGKTAEPPKHAK